MASKRHLLDGARLCVIVDADACGSRDPVEVAAEAVAGGADIIQWRAKSLDCRRRWETARRMADALRPLSALFIVNDHVDVAMAAAADGVHVGQDDLPPPVVRGLIGPGRVMGISTHSLAQAEEAEAAGADYIGVGPVFATPTKPDSPPVGLGLVQEVSRRILIPFVAIGGIDRLNLPLVLSSGARRVAVVRAVAGSSDVRSAAQAFKAMLT